MIKAGSIRNSQSGSCPRPFESYEERQKRQSTVSRSPFAVPKLPIG